MSRRRKRPLPEAPSISVERARQQYAELLWLDIRGAPFCQHSIAGAHTVAHDDADALLTQHPDKLTVLFCEDGVASRHAVSWLYAQGKQDIAWLEGGFRYWQQQYPETLVSYQIIKPLTNDETG